jgi:o-succinylbenzoate---CoA ligase
MRSVITLPSDGARTFGAHVAGLLGALGAAQRGTGPAVEVLEGPAAGEFIQTFPQNVPTGTAAVIRTSGSTGMPKRTALPAASLAASAAATRKHLGGDGHWLLALPLHYVAGLAVLSRALLGDTRVATLDLRERFTPQAFTAATRVLKEHAALDADLLEEAPLPLYTSLVPTQLTRLLEDDDATEALRSYAAVLVGGGRTPDATRARAREAGIAVVLTYGSAETCGGCVYDGVPLPGVTAESVDGRLRLGGAMVAGPYLGDDERTAEHFSEERGTRFYLTDDLGEVSNGVLSVSGRVDDVINTGGVKVSAQAVQRVIEELPGVRGVLVIGVPDPEWGQRVGLVLEEAPGARTPVPDDAAVASAVRAVLGAPAVPRLVWRPAALPRLGNGKPDRRTSVAALEALAREA